MDQKEAREVLAKELARFRSQTYEELQRLLKAGQTHEVQGPSSITYQVEIQAFWDSHPAGDIRVMGAIDDKSFWRAVRPLCEDFIMAPDGRFVGEDAGVPGTLHGGYSAVRRFGLLSSAAGAMGLVAWCILDFVLVTFAPARIHDFDWALACFPLAVLPAGLYVFRDLGSAAQVGLSIAVALAASVVAVLLVLLLGIPFHLSIGGNL